MKTNEKTNNSPVNRELAAEDDDFVIILTKPGDEQAAPEYRNQYYEISDRLSDIIIKFGDDES